MPAGTLVAPVSTRAIWAGRVISGVSVLFLLFDGVGHLMRPAPVVAAFAQLGYPIAMAVGIGILQMVCVVLYVIPRTAILGAVLLTGFLGGAVASQVRVGHTMFECIFPILIGGLVWGGIFLRDEHLRRLIPLRS